jgi:hypothetical protein
MKHYRTVGPLVSLLSVVAIGVFSSGTPSRASAQTTGPWTMQGHDDSHDCMRIQSDSRSNNAQVEMGLCTGSDEWDWRHVNGNLYRIINRNSGKCMAVKNDSSTRGAKVIQTTCNHHYSELWEPVIRQRGDSDWYILKNYETGLCLNIQGASEALGADLIQWTCDVARHNDWFTWFSSF